MLEQYDVVPTLITVVVLLSVATVVLSLAGVRHRLAVVLAVVRGTLQLAAISVLLTGVISDPFWVAVALSVMFTVAAVTSTRRLHWSWAKFGVVAGSMAAGVSVVMVTVFATGALEFSPRYVLALGGIIIGGSMAVATLAGRRLGQATTDRWDEVEGWLALGATNRQATVDIAKFSIWESLIPSTDQTKTTGLVTLPGAFVGAIFGGVAPVEAGLFQMVVLSGIVAAGAITASMMVYVLAPKLERADI